MQRPAYSRPLLIPLDSATTVLALMGTELRNRTNVHNSQARVRGNYEGVSAGHLSTQDIAALQEHRDVACVCEMFCCGKAG